MAWLFTHAGYKFNETFLVSVSAVAADGVNFCLDVYLFIIYKYIATARAFVACSLKLSC